VIVKIDALPSESPVVLVLNRREYPRKAHFGTDGIWSKKLMPQSKIFDTPTPRSTTGLKACRCKAPGYVHQEETPAGPTYQVLCRGCERKTKPAKTLQAAVAAWNGRTE
jgi:hypothetical protein